MSRFVHGRNMKYYETSHNSLHKVSERVILVKQTGHRVGNPLLHYINLSVTAFTKYSYDVWVELYRYLPSVPA
jgi:hypothetical protein